jgi:hypothetical protein
MSIQTASTTELDEAQRVIIAKARMTQEFDAPMLSLVEHFTLAKGEKQLTIPKVGQMEASDLTDGVDMTASADIGMTAEQIDCEEVGLKVIITDKLARQLNEDVFAMVGRQVGDAMARKKDKDLLALFDTLTNLGVGDEALSLTYYAAVATRLQAVPAPLPISCVVHPYQAHPLKTAQAVSGTYPIPQAGLSVDVIKQWHVGTWAGVPCFEDGNLTITSSTAKGAMFSKSCLGYLQSLADTTERERDASLRATELVIVSDYEAFIIDSTYGFEMYYTCAAPAVND